MHFCFLDIEVQPTTPETLPRAEAFQWLHHEACTCNGLRIYLFHRIGVMKESESVSLRPNRARLVCWNPRGNLSRRKGVHRENKGSLTPLS